MELEFSVKLPLQLDTKDIGRTLYEELLCGRHFLFALFAPVRVLF
jgi:hypothetical protein